MAVQQRKVSKQKCRQRKSANRYRGATFSLCTRCGKPRVSHCVCPACGYYKDQQVISVET